MQYEFDHEEIALDCDSYGDYLEEVAYHVHQRELLDSLFWCMSEEDKEYYLFEALRNLNVHCLYEEEFDDVHS